MITDEVTETNFNVYAFLNGYTVNENGFSTYHAGYPETVLEDGELGVTSLDGENTTTTDFS